MPNIPGNNTFQNTFLDIFHEIPWQTFFIKYFRKYFGKNFALKNSGNTLANTFQALGLQLVEGSPPSQLAEPRCHSLKNPQGSSYNRHKNHLLSNIVEYWQDYRLSASQIFNISLMAEYSHLGTRSSEYWNIQYSSVPISKYPNIQDQLTTITLAAGPPSPSGSPLPRPCRQVSSWSSRWSSNGGDGDGDDNGDDKGGGDGGGCHDQSVNKTMIDI